MRFRLPMLALLPFPLLAANGHVAVVDTASGGGNLFVGGHMSSASDPDRITPVEGALDFGFSGTSNTLGLKDWYSELNYESSSTSSSGSTSSSELTCAQIRMAVIGFEFRQYLRPIKDPKHDPFLSATAEKILNLSIDGSGSRSASQKLGGFALGFGIGEEVPVGAPPLWGRIGGRYQSLEYQVSSSSSSSGSYSTRSTSTLKSTRTYVNTDLDVSLGMSYRY